MALSRQASEQLKVEHIDKVLLELQKRFGFNFNHWKAEFEKHRKLVYGDVVPVTSAFLSFGTAHINPLLNKILGRDEKFPTFTNLVNFVVTGKEHKGRWVD